MMLEPGRRDHDGGVFPKAGHGAVCPLSGQHVGRRAKKYPLGLRGIREPDPIRLEDMVLYERERGAGGKHAPAARRAAGLQYPALRR